jgi:hypothetical protein
MTDYDPTEEYALLAQAGLSFADVLAALTTAPAKRLARVRYTIRGGRIIYGK